MTDIRKYATGTKEQIGKWLHSGPFNNSKNMLLSVLMTGKKVLQYPFNVQSLKVCNNHIAVCAEAVLVIPVEPLEDGSSHGAA